MRQTAGAISCTGTPSWTKPDGLPRLTIASTSLGGGRRPRHHPRNRLSGRSAASSRRQYRRAPARAVYASPSTISVLVPGGLDGGRTAVRVDGVPGETALLEVGTPFATGLHQVDNPVFDREGNLYVTYSGSRGQEVPVSIFRVGPNGRRESFVSGIVNPTSMTFDASGSSTSRAGSKDRSIACAPNGTHETYASDLGIACGLAFDRERRAVCRRSIGNGVCRAARSNGQRARHAAAERGGLSSGGRARRLRVRVSPDARPVRSRLSPRSQHRHRRSCLFADSDGRRASRSTRRARSTSLKRWRDRTGSIACGRTARPNLSWRGPHWSAWRSIRPAALSWRRTTRRIG